MKFIDFSSKNKKNTIELLLVLAIIAIVFVISVFWSVKPEVYARDFLPNETVFYYELTSIDNFADQDNHKLFDYSVAGNHLERITTIMTENFTELESFIWFRVESSDQDSYLVRISKYPDNLVENLSNSYPEFYYNRLNKDILLISELEDVATKPTKQVVGRFNVNYINKGTNLYIDLRYAPEFLQKFADSVTGLVAHPEIFINLSDKDINFYQARRSNEPLERIEQSNLYTYVRQPKNFDAALGTNQKSVANLEKFVSQTILLPVFNSLPYHNLSFSDLENYFLDESIIYQKEKSWLVAKAEDWQPVVESFAKTFEVEESKKLLPDGTLYIEYVASGSPTVTEHQYKGMVYWQIDSLYGWDVDSVHYLSNDESMIKEIIEQDKSVGVLMSDCNQDKQYFIKDFIILDTAKLPEGDFKVYLNSRNIKQLNMFGYFNNVSTGILLCQ